MCQAHAALQTATHHADPAVLSKLLAHREEFHRFLERRLGDTAAADEVLQEAFVKSLDRLCTLRDPDAVIGWFYRVLRNAVNDRFRAWEVERRRAAGLVETEALPAPEPEPEGRPCACLHGAVDQLKPEYAWIVRAVDLEGQTVKDFAAANGISASNAGVRAFRARAALLRQIQHTCGACAEGHCRDCTCAAA